MSRPLTPEQAGYTPEQVAACRTKYADMMAQREMNKHKNGKPQNRLSPKTRRYKLQGQDGCCALCGLDIPPDRQACHDKQNNHILCRRCMMGLVHIRSMLKDGITFDMIIAYQQNQPEQIEGEPNVNQ